MTMEIQGTERQIADTIEGIQRGRYIRIDYMEEKTIDVDPDERGFRVRYH